MSPSKRLNENKHLLIIAAINFFLIYLSVFNTSYGYFIDEFYYIACANRPAFGYVDHPPLAPFILTVFQFLFGNSVYGLRILPALASSISVFMTGIITKKIGGSIYAQIISAVAVMCIPTLAALAGFYSMNAFEPLLTILMFYFILKMIETNNPKEWILTGIITGLGLMNKHTFGIIALFIVISLLVSGYRRYIFNKWFYIAATIAFLMFLPNIIWQAANNFPTLEFYRNITVDKNVYTPPLEFIINQIITMSPAIVLIWLPGFIYFLFSKRYKAFRFISVFFFLSFLFFMLSGTSRADRLSFVYPIILTAGAVFWENLILRFNTKWVMHLIVFLLLSCLAIVVPIALPYFSYEQVRDYTAAIGLNTELERGNKPPLPQLLADRIGWEEKVELMGKAFNSLSPDEKRRSIIAGDNYGQAGALELLGREYNFPIVVSGHNNYYLWSKGKIKGDILLQFDDDGRGLKKAFNSVVEYPGMFFSPFVTSHENNIKVFICRGPKYPPEEMLDAGRFYY